MNCNYGREYTCSCSEFAYCPMTRYCGEGCESGVLEDISSALDSIAGSLSLCLALHGGCPCRCR